MDTDTTNVQPPARHAGDAPPEGNGHDPEPASVATRPAGVDPRAAGADPLQSALAVLQPLADLARAHRECIRGAVMWRTLPGGGEVFEVRAYRHLDGRTAPVHVSLRSLTVDQLAAVVLEAGVRIAEWECAGRGCECGEPAERVCAGCCEYACEAHAASEACLADASDPDAHDDALNGRR
jgi:hypothetical protein